MSKNLKVCVTGGAGYIASYLIKHLLERGYTVHATLRNLNDASKVGLLKGLAHAETNLKLFKADIYNSVEFAAAIDGCTFVLHIATPLQHNDSNSQYKNIAEASVAGVKIIVDSCIKSKTVKRLIYTSSATASAPLKEDGSGYKDVIDEECWTPLNLTSGMFAEEYIYSKLLAEKEVLAYNGKGIEVVSLVLPEVAGDTVQSIPISLRMLISQPLRDEEAYTHLRDYEDLAGKIAFAHIRDVAEAYIFSIENPHINGRFIVANSYLTTAEIASIILKLYPDLTIPPEFIKEFKREIKWGVRKLQDLGFEYKFDAEKTIDATIVCAKRLGIFEVKHQ